MSHQSDALKQRAKALGVDVLRLIDKLPKTPGAQVVASQLARSATSVGSNYIAACNARSRREVIAKLGVVNEEADESVNWLQVIIAVPYLPEVQVASVLQEAIELRPIVARSLGTARLNDRIVIANPK